MPTSKKLIDLPELGSVILKKHKQARYIKIRVEEQGKVSVVMPNHVRYDSAVDFLKEKIDWIKQEQEKFSIISPPITAFKTKFRELELIPCDIGKATFRLSPTRIKVYYSNAEYLQNAQGSGLEAPSLRACRSEAKAGVAISSSSERSLRRFAPHDDETQVLIHTAIEKALRLEAKVYLPRRLDELAKKHNLKYQKLRIKNTKTRWGSCSSENNINLCSHLMKLPDELIDYVILHELAHTVEKNHSEKFWALLSNLLGTSAKVLDRKLKSYKTSL